MFRCCNVLKRCLCRFVGHSSRPQGVQMICGRTSLNRAATSRAVCYGFSRLLRLLHIARKQKVRPACLTFRHRTSRTPKFRFRRRTRDWTVLRSWTWACCLLFFITLTIAYHFAMAARNTTTAVARAAVRAASKQATRQFSAVATKAARPASKQAQNALKAALAVRVRARRGTAKEKRLSLSFGNLAEPDSRCQDPRLCRYQGDRLRARRLARSQAPGVLQERHSCSHRLRFPG